MRVTLRRLAVLTLFVPVARATTWAAVRALGRRAPEGVRVMDLGPTDEIRAEALDRIGAALRLLSADSPRTLARLRRRAAFVALAHGEVGVVYDAASGGISVNRAFAAAAAPERTALQLGVGAAMASFRWANFRPPADVRAQMHRRIVREARALAAELSVSYPTLEWLEGWLGRLPLSAAANEALSARHARSINLPPWVLRLRRLLWE